MKSMRTLCRVWLYGAGIGVYTYLIALMSASPFIGTMLWFFTHTKDKAVIDRVNVIVVLSGLLVGPLVFGWLFYLAVGRRLKWHNLMREHSE